MCGRERDAVQETNNEEKYVCHGCETRCQGARGSARDGTSRVRSRNAAFIGAECELSPWLDTSPDTIYHFRILRKCSEDGPDTSYILPFQHPDMCFGIRLRKISHISLLSVYYLRVTTGLRVTNKYSVY